MAQMPPGVLATLLARMGQPLAGAGFRAALQPKPGAPAAPPAPPAPAPLAPVPPAAIAPPPAPPQQQQQQPLLQAPSPYEALGAAPADAEVQAALHNLEAWKPYGATPPTYTPPQYREQQIAPPNRGFEIGTLLGALMMPRNAGATASALAYDTQEREQDQKRRAEQEQLRYAAEQRNAEAQYQSQNAESNRQVALNELDLRERTARLTAAEASRDRELNVQERASYHTGYLNNLHDRAQTYAKSVNDRYITNEQNLQLNYSRLNEKAKQDAALNGIRQNGQILQYEANFVRGQFSLTRTGMHDADALFVARMQLRGRLAEEAMRQNAANGRAIFQQNNANYRAQLSDKLRALNATISRAATPGSTPVDQKAAQDAAGQMNELLTQMQTSSGGQFRIPETTWDQDFQRIQNESAQAAQQQALPSAGGGTPQQPIVQNFYGGAPGAPSYPSAPTYGGASPYGMTPPSGAPGSTPGMQDWMRSYGAGGGAPAPAGAPAAPAGPPTTGSAPRHDWQSLPHAARQHVIDATLDLLGHVAKGPVTVSGTTYTSPQQVIAEFEQGTGMKWAQAVAHDRSATAAPAHAAPPAPPTHAAPSTGGAPAPDPREAALRASGATPEQIARAREGWAHPAPQQPFRIPMPPTGHTEGITIGYRPEFPKDKPQTPVDLARGMLTSARMVPGMSNPAQTHVAVLRTLMAAPYHLSQQQAEAAIAQAQGGSNAAARPRMAGM